jgi:type I restriction enzyme S subunit
MSFPRYSKYKPSGVEWLDDVPEHWVVRRLKQVVDSKRQITYGIVQAGPHVPDGVPYIRPADMTDEQGVLEPGDVMRTSPEIAGSYSRSMIAAGDLICSIGPSFGKVMITPDWLSGANLTQGTARIAVQPGQNPRYFFWVLRSAVSIAQWESSVGGATFRALNLGPLVETSIPVPSASDQFVIAAFLDRETAKIDGLVAGQQRLIGLLKEKRQAFISHAVTKGLNPRAPMKHSGIEWIGDIPEHWSMRRVKHVSIFTTSGPRGWSERVGEEGQIFVQSGDLNDSLDVDFSNAKRVQVEGGAETSRTQLYHGDVVVCITGAKTGNVAVCMVVPEPAYVNQHLCLVRPDCKGVVPAFLGILLKSRIGQTYFELSQYGLKQGLSLENVREAPVLLPPISEQASIVAFIGAETVKLDSLTAEAQRAIVLLQERRAALISAAVTGQIDVRGLINSETT